MFLILKNQYPWTYRDSPQLSEVLKAYKKRHQDEYLTPPAPKKRGILNAPYIAQHGKDEVKTQELIYQWGHEVFQSWIQHHPTAQQIAHLFLQHR